MIPPSNSMFLYCILLMTSLSISSNSWIMLWATMEMNMLTFLPLIKTTFLTVESMIKYLLIQSSSSTMILSIMITPLNLLIMAFMLATMTKLGAAPCHNWLISMIKPMKWLPFMLISTWQKLIPLLLISFVTTQKKPTNPMMMFMLTGLVWAPTAALNQNQMRLMLTYSSIAHLSWIITLSLKSIFMMTLYTVTYFSIMITLLIPLSNHFTSAFWKTSNIFINQNTNLMIPLSMMSMSGMPPMMGFFMKWLALITITKMMNPITPIFIMSSMISILFYMTISMNIFLYHQSITYKISNSCFLMFMMMNSASFFMFCLS